MLDLITIGHISIDLSFQGKNITYEEDRFQLAVGGKYVADTFRETLGGGGFNVAMAVKNNDLHVGIIATVGNNDFKKVILEKLTQANFPLDLLINHPNYINISAILLRDDGERSIINYETPHTSLLSQKTRDHLRTTHTVYLGNLPEVSFQERKSLLGFLKENDILSIVNLGVKDCRRPKDELEDFFKDVDIIIANGHEFADMAKHPYETIDFKKSVFPYLPSLKGKQLIITDSKKGSYGYMGANVYYQKAYEPKKIVDVTGAGDGYSGGFIAEFLKSNDIVKSMEKGAQYAAKILETVGANY